MWWGFATVHKVNGEAEKCLTGLWTSIFPNQRVAAAPVSSLLSWVPHHSPVIALGDCDDGCIKQQFILLPP